MNITVKSGLAALAFAAFATGAQAADIVVGGKNFTEQQILSAITQQVLEANGHRVDNRAGMGSAAVRQAMENGQIDVYWEYTGTSLITYNKIEEKLDPQQTYDTVKELDAQKGIVWLNPSQANNTYGLAMRAADAGEKGIASISDLAAAINGGQALSFGSNAEFYARPDGLKPLETAYGFEFGRANVKRMDTGLVYQALRDGQVDVGLVFATDGRIPAFDFTVLEDDQGYFPSYALAPVIRTEVLEANPGIGDLLNEVSAKLDDQVMAALNASVDVDKVSVENAAAKFLQDNGLI
ncbi:glycine betaine ABC transporter substrate-binding protein (plasmid) [Paracoccus versutus]|uniref:Osmoprotectant transport system substrate-binding protein n=1 Tax=Paracoccus versutus TaxID=34007 RepID=A0AAQ0HGQ9_PARVE|nr:glycine betaine ABC transporter substrate-binding protein [Paracoccus versutus]KGJ12124.1 glycine/betaine ABC transporter substrate-binding protein [Paracoccus versutus]REG44588.1 osmoprotectant transport system substrate-binding protein [Paracoccus versutus]WEJ80541.1 glycine betaine ABC transporter substrate-binding protein [Paracoccus versutus]